MAVRFIRLAVFAVCLAGFGGQFFMPLAAQGAELPAQPAADAAPAINTTDGMASEPARDSAGGLAIPAPDLASPAAGDSAAPVAEEGSGPPAAAAVATDTSSAAGDSDPSGENAPSKESATAPAAKLPDVNGSGSLNYSYDLDVPTFHGIEPDISLHYASNRKSKTGGLYQGWLGLGWSLKGFDVIERTRPNGGVPAYDANDEYVLNGERILSCTNPLVVNSNASCASGGEWVSENENYQRIKFLNAANQWEITGRDGTKVILSSAGEIAGFNPAGKTADQIDLAGRYRWLVTLVKDTHGNEVLYTYDCDTLPTCYPKAVNYNLTSVRFFLEERNDYITAANGHTLSAITKRIRSVKVTNNNHLTSA